MGGNTGAVSMTAEQLQARAKEIQNFYTESGMTLPESFQDKKTGALFTYKKDEDGKIICTYDYHNVRQKDIILFPKTTVPTSRAGLGNLTDAQFEEYLANNPYHMYSTEYAAGDEAIKKKNTSQVYLNAYDKDTRKAARNDYRDIVTEELLASGSFDPKAAKKMGKYATNDAIASERSFLRQVFVDKAAYKAAKKELELQQEIAKELIKNFNKSGKAFDSLPLDQKIKLENAMTTMEMSVEYIKDKDIRAYVNDPKNRDRFFEQNPKTGAYEFSSYKYKEWARSHNQGDSTITTTERKAASMATGLSEKDTKKAAEYAGFDAQKDHTLTIELAKSIVGALSGTLIAYMTNANIHDIKYLKDSITIVADNADPSKYTVFIDGVVLTEAKSEVIANFRNVAVRNAALGSALALIFNNGLIDPEGARDRKADGITAATISTQNIFRGNEVTDIEGEIVIDGEEEDCDDDVDGCKAALKKVVTPEGNKTEDVVYEKSYFKEENKVSYWYDFAAAYDFPKGRIKDVYKAIQQRNGFTKERPNPPLNVMLPLELTLSDGTVVTRKAKYTIAKQERPTGKGNGKGNAPGGKPVLQKIPGSTKVMVFDCEGRPVAGNFDETTARAKYKEITGKDFEGEIPQQ